MLPRHVCFRLLRVRRSVCLAVPVSGDSLLFAAECFIPYLSCAAFSGHVRIGLLSVRSRMSSALSAVFSFLVLNSTCPCVGFPRLSSVATRAP